MGVRRLGAGQISKKTKDRNMRRHNKRRPVDKARRQQAIKMGQQLKRSGVVVGRKHIPITQIPNLTNYRDIMKGMGQGTRLVDLRKEQRRKGS